MLSDPKKIWNRVLEIIKDKVSAQVFSTWFEQTQGDSLHQDTLWIKVPNAFFIDWIEEHYHPLIHDTVSIIYGEPLKVRYRVMEPTKDKMAPDKVYHIDSSHLQPRYTFDNFIVGDGNKFAHAAALAVANAPGKHFNPLFIYGTVGLGKTHLLQAIGNYIKEHSGALKVYYTGCETIMNEMIDAIQNNRTVQFKKKYRYKDVLLIDDIQFLEGKESLQEEIFHTFNSLYEVGHQIVFSSDRPPSALSSLEERLVSRFGGGLVCDIKPPGLETRIAILKKKAEASGVQVPNEIISFIAERIKSNIRELEGALITLLARASLTDERITIESAHEFLKETISAEKNEVTVEKIQKVVASHYNISLAALRGKRRMRSIVIPRQIAIYLSREYTPLSLKEIGRIFGGKDHATVIHAYDRVKKLLEKNNEIQDEVTNIVKLITSE
ncbi:MAG: chromosomal replication initiator protein DnaA [bacterium]|nr:chromosomal replication initiator protein DnaA [bacterium]